MTASAPKSVSVLFALGDDATRGAALDAHDAAVAAMVDWIETHAHTRYRVDGEVQIRDADGIAVACFRQHTSRALDPQLHTPNRTVRQPGLALVAERQGSVAAYELARNDPNARIRAGPTP